MTIAWATGVPKIIGGTAEPDPRVIRLTPAQTRAIGAVVADGVVYCSATLITPRVALTAAHCGNYLEEFRTGRDITRPEAKARILALAFQPRYQRGTPGHDVALAYLDHDMDVDPIRIGGPPDVEEQVQTAGYGRTIPDTPGNTERFWLVETVGSVNEVEFSVTQHGEHGQCMGDSGGPALVMRDGYPVLVGTVSHGDANCVGVDFYTRADSVGDWIENTLEAWKAHPPRPPVRTAAVGWGIGLLFVGLAVGIWARRGAK